MIHTARAIDELVLLAPLLDHPTIFDLRLHFTGNLDALKSLAPCSVPLPAPVLLPLPDPAPAKKSRYPLELPQSLVSRLPDVHSLDKYSVVSDRKSELGIRASASMPDLKGSKKAEKGGPSGRRLMGMHGKWESLLVWVGAWLASFWTLVCFSACCLCFCFPRVGYFGTPGHGMSMLPRLLSTFFLPLCVWCADDRRTLVPQCV